MIQDLIAILAAILLFEGLCRTGVIRRGGIVAEDLFWVVPVAGVASAGTIVFGFKAPFLVPFLVLAVLHLARTGLGWIGPETSSLVRWRFVPVVLLAAVTGSFWGAVALFLLMTLNRDCLRALLLSVARVETPKLLTPMDVDQIVPPRITYRRVTGESGMAMLELIMGMMMLITLSSAVFLGATQRSARLRQLRETTVVRETVVSELERVSAVPFEDLSRQNGREFEVPGAGGRGRVAVRFPEDGLAKITVEAPRRGATAIRLETWRSRRAE